MRLTEVEKEHAVIGYIVGAGFKGVPDPSRTRPTAFTSELRSVIYEAAVYLHRNGKHPNGLTVTDAIKADRTLSRIAEQAAIDEGLPDWECYLAQADASLLFNPAGGAVVAEFLDDITHAEGLRESVQIGKMLTEARISLPDAVEALARIKQLRGSNSWDACLVAAEDLCDDRNSEVYKAAPAIIEGLLAQGDLSLITAGSKSFKSWLALQIAICTANGIPFLNRKTIATKTLVLNFELKPASIKNRIASIAQRLKCGRRNLYTWNLRNMPITPAFLERLTARINDDGFGLVVLDPLYSMYGVVDDPNVENSNPAMTQLLSTIRVACEAAGAAVIVVHHHAKGDSTAKASIDRGSGAGALGRFPDFVMSLIRHEAPNAYTVEIDFRDFPPCDPFVIRREGCIMVLDQDLDPAAKKKSKPPANQKVFVADVVAAMPEEGKTIDRKALETTIAHNKHCSIKTAKRVVDHALGLKICKVNGHGIYLPKQEVQTRF